MSSKLVKKQLGSLLAVEKTQIASQKQLKNKTNRRKKKTKTQKNPTAEIAEALAVRRANLQYFTKTQPTDKTKDLLVQVLRARGGASAPPIENQNEDLEFDDFF